MKKAAAVLMILIITVLFSACAAALSFRLDEYNAVGVSYMADLSGIEDGGTDYLNQLKEYWEELGFSAAVDNDELTVTGEIFNEHDTAAQAAADFAGIVTSGNVMFYDVLFEYTPSFEYDLYSFSARISLNEIVRQSQAQDMPSDIITSLRNDAARGEYTVSIKLPGAVSSSNADSVEDGTCTWTLEYGKETELQVKTKKINAENLAYRASLESGISGGQVLLAIFAAAGAASLLGVTAAVIIRRARLRRASIVRARKFR